MLNDAQEHFLIFNNLLLLIEKQEYYYQLKIKKNTFRYYKIMKLLLLIFSLIRFAMQSQMALKSRANAHS